VAVWLQIEPPMEQPLLDYGNLTVPSLNRIANSVHLGCAWTHLSGTTLSSWF
jgi:hypothetical protein